MSTGFLFVRCEHRFEPSESRVSVMTTSVPNLSALDTSTLKNSWPDSFLRAVLVTDIPELHTTGDVAQQFIGDGLYQFRNFFDR